MATIRQALLPPMCIFIFFFFLWTPYGIASPPLLGCPELQARLRLKSPINAGMLTQVYKGKLDGKRVVVKRIGSFTHDKALPKEWQISHFLNRINFVRLRIHHRNLMDVIGVCDDPENLMLVAEYLPGRLTSLRSYEIPEGNETVPFDADFIAKPLSYRLRVATEMAELVAFLSERNASRPGSPYVLCDPSLPNFIISEDGTVKFADLDKVTPMTPSAQYPFSHSWETEHLHRPAIPPPRSSHKSLPTSQKRLKMSGVTSSDTNQPGPRIFEGTPCSKGCSYNCLFRHMEQLRSRGSEYRCKPSRFYCPGLGVRASTYWVAKIFLQPLLGHERQMLPGIANLIEASLSLHESQRPHPQELATKLRKWWNKMFGR